MQCRGFSCNEEPEELIRYAALIHNSVKTATSTEQWETSCLVVDAFGTTSWLFPHSKHRHGLPICVVTTMHGYWLCLRLANYWRNRVGVVDKADWRSMHICENLFKRCDHGTKNGVGFKLDTYIVKVHLWLGRAPTSRVLRLLRTIWGIIELFPRTRDLQPGLARWTDITLLHTRFSKHYHGPVDMNESGTVLATAEEKRSHSASPWCNQESGRSFWASTILYHGRTLSCCSGHWFE
jgi:hypothetical protein